MFFTRELLVGPKGQFALLWRASVKKEKLKKKQLESLDLAEICKALLEYMRPRYDSRMSKIHGFSLRLSAQLVHGVIVCYNWKVAYFLDDAMSSWKAVCAKRYLVQELSAPPPKMKKTRRGTVAEENFQLDINFDADPLFGQMLSVDLAEFPAIAPPHTTTEESTSPSSSENAKKKRQTRKHVVADLGQITLQEGIDSTILEGEDMLARREAEEFNLDDLNALAEGPSLFDAAPSTSKEPPVAISRMETTPAGAILPDTPVLPRVPTRRQTRAQVEESILAVPIQPDPITMDVDAAVGPAVQHPSRETSALLVEPSPLVLESLTGFPLPVGRRRKQRKLIVDSKIELRSDEIKKQLKTRYRTIEDYRNEGHLDEPMNLVPAEVLFSNATIHGTCFDSSRVWIEQARDDPLEEVTIRNTFNATISNISRDLEMSRISGDRDQTIGRQMEDSSVQAGRDVSAMSGLALTLPGEEHSVARRTRSTRSLSGRTRSGRESDMLEREEILPPPDQESVMPDIPFPEMMAEQSGIDDLEFGQIEIEKPEIDYYTQTTLLSEIYNIWERGVHTTFESLATPGVTTKPEAAKKFYTLLTCAKNGAVELVQTSPFGEIEIGKYHRM